MTQLLVSVRSMQEASAALIGGADVIDVKEPERGSLGKANDDVTRNVLRLVHGCRPVSAALGELRQVGLPRVMPGLAFVKWGLAGCSQRVDWRKEWALAAELLPVDTEAVYVAYADAELAEAPPVFAVLEFARSGGVLLIDTYRKEARNTLLDFLPPEQLADITDHCRSRGIRLALAGCLGLAEIKQLLPLRPDWFAVRGAVCADGQRQGPVISQRVAQLRALLLEADLERLRED